MGRVGLTYIQVEPASRAGRSAPCRPSKSQARLPPSITAAHCRRYVMVVLVLLLVGTRQWCRPKAPQQLTLTLTLTLSGVKR